MVVKRSKILHRLVSKLTQCILYCVLLTPICENFYPVRQPYFLRYTVFLSV